MGTGLYAARTRHIQIRLRARRHLKEEAYDMRETENTNLVKQAYAAFGRGDVQGVLDTLHPDVRWRPVTGASAAVPMAGERRGRNAVAEFFATLAASLTFEVFEPREFVAQGNKVIALGYYKGRTAPGRPFESDWVMVFTVVNGQVSEFQEFADVSALNAAYDGVTA
jgi:ketosteroid isomerase-like protein